MPKAEFKYDEDDPRPYDVQYQEWLLVVDTVAYDISTYPGCSAEQVSGSSNHKVITKRGNRNG